MHWILFSLILPGLLPLASAAAPRTALAFRRVWRGHELAIRRGGALALCLMLIPLFTGAGCETNPATGKKQLILIPDDMEIALGANSAAQFESELGGPVEDAALQRRIAAIGQSLARASQRPKLPYRFTVLNSETPNAFALPGGPIYITKGILDLLDNDDAMIAAVLGHEVGHINARHSVMQLQTALGMELLLTAAEGRDGGQSSATAAGRVAGSLLMLKYSRDDELQADQLGMDYLAATKREPDALIRVMERLASLDKSQPNLIADLTRTHPHAATRAERARSYIATMRGAGKFPKR